MSQRSKKVKFSEMQEYASDSEDDSGSCRMEIQRHTDFSTQSTTSFLQAEASQLSSSSSSGWHLPADPPSAFLEEHSMNMDIDHVDDTNGDNGDNDDLAARFLDPNYVQKADVIDDEVETQIVQIEAPRTRYQADDPLKMWMSDRDTFLAEIIRLEGPGRDSAHCSSCQLLFPSTLKPDAVDVVRCISCLDNSLLCQECMIKRHATTPFHRFQSWNGRCFSNTSLNALGYHWQLGHRLDEKCISPSRTTNFVVVDVNGIYELSLDFCGCRGVPDRVTQLLRSRLFPATVVNPQTAVTFRFLETFQMLNFMSKISVFEYYQTIVRLTDNTGTKSIPDRYKEVRRVVREWRHIRMLKRAGRGHSDGGPAGTQPGECAVLCPACPYPDINLPDNYSSLPDSWKYALFLGIDANFQLKRADVSSELKDPGLNQGYAYYVNATQFKQHLEEFGAKIVDDKSSCNDHNAIKQASMRGGKGTASTGIGAVDCARHDMKRLLSVGDLQKGERYVNMDYFFLSSVGQRTPSSLVVSYDIGCQWSRNLFKRIEEYPVSLRPDQNQKMQFLVPKFHLAAHIPLCQAYYSFNFTRHVGRTDGEAPERGWAAANAMCTSIREMGPGSYRDTLDDIFGDYNYRKRLLLPTQMLRKLEDAIDSKLTHEHVLDLLTKALPSDSVQTWEESVKAWEADSKKPNPFFSTSNTASFNSVRLELVEEDATIDKEEEKLHTVTPSSMILRGLNLEEEQAELEWEEKSLAKKLHATPLQKSKVIESGIRLQRKIDAWTVIQEIYIPRLGYLRSQADAEAAKVVPASSFPLMLPSACDNTIKVNRNLLRYEFRLRIARANDILGELRRHLLLRNSLWQYKLRFIRGQDQLTRSQAVINNVIEKVRADTARYRRNYSALLKLGSVLGETSWKTRLRDLADEDVVAFKDAPESEGKRTLSWIWLVEGVSHDENIVNEVLSIEWCKARTRAHRYAEEVVLLEEEMRRVKAFYEWQISTWQSRAKVLSVPNDRFARPMRTQEYRDGAIAYAWRQVDITSRMLCHCENVWKDVGLLLSDPLAYFTSLSDRRKKRGGREKKAAVVVANILKRVHTVEG